MHSVQGFGRLKITSRKKWIIGYGIGDGFFHEESGRCPECYNIIFLHFDAKKMIQSEIPRQFWCHSNENSSWLLFSLFDIVFCLLLIPTQISWTSTNHQILGFLFLKLWIQGRTDGFFVTKGTWKIPNLSLVTSSLLNELRSYEIYSGLLWLIYV